MAKKKQKIPEKKASMTWVYVGLAVFVIAALAIYSYSGSTSNKTDPSTNNSMKGETLALEDNQVQITPSAGKFGTMNKPSTYEVRYLFSWDEIPGNDSVKFIDFLNQKYSIDWVKTAKIEKIDDGRTIKVSVEKNNLSLSLNNEKTKVNLKIDSGRTDVFIANTINDKLKIYEPGKIKITEFLKFNCGHCYSLNSLMPAIKKKYGDRLEITYKPMLWKNVKGDPVYKKSIEAYILANRTGKGEEMKDALFNAVFVENRDITSEIQLGDIGKSVGLGDEFITALKNGDATDEADANIKLAESLPVDETPTIVINGNLKVTSSMTNGDATQMANNLDTIINSLLS